MFLYYVSTTTSSSSTHIPAGTGGLSVFEGPIIAGVPNFQAYFTCIYPVSTIRMQPSTLFFRYMRVGKFVTPPNTQVD